MVVEISSWPEAANAGMWYFGARIAPDRIIYNRGLRDLRYAHELSDAHVARAQRRDRCVARSDAIGVHVALTDGCWHCVDVTAGLLQQPTGWSQSK